MRKPNIYSLSFLSCRQLRLRYSGLHLRSTYHHETGIELQPLISFLYRLNFLIIVIYTVNDEKLSLQRGEIAFLSGLRSLQGFCGMIYRPV